MKAPVIEFPCEYPIKIMGRAHALFRQTVLEVVSRHDPEFCHHRVQQKNSSRGAYISLTVWITATDETQLKQLFEDLKATGKVIMVL